MLLQATTPAQTSSVSIAVGTPPTHGSGDASDGGVTWTFVADESIAVLRLSGNGWGQINDFKYSSVRRELRTNRANW